MILCKIGELAACVKNRSNAWYDCVFKEMYKIVHKAFANTKATNVDMTAFVAFSDIPKLRFGNVIYYAMNILCI